MSAELGQYFSALDATQLGALIETMVLAGEADGEFEADERRSLGSLLDALVDGTRLAGELSDARLEEWLASAREAIEREGREARVASVRERLASALACEGALVLAARIVASDGVVRTSERELLLELAEGLSLDADRAADLVRAQATAR
jgi:tellurite resistance protein